MVTEIELFESPDLTSLDFCLYGCMTGEVDKRKVSCSLELYFVLLPTCRNVKSNSDAQPATSVRELQSAMRLLSVFRTFTMNCNKPVISV